MPLLSVRSVSRLVSSKVPVFVLESTESSKADICLFYKRNLPTLGHLSNEIAPSCSSALQPLVVPQLGSDGSVRSSDGCWNDSQDMCKIMCSYSHITRRNHGNQPRSRSGADEAGIDMVRWTGIRYSQENIIEKLQEMATKKDGRKFSQQEFCREMKISSSTVKRHFGSFDEARRQAGVCPRLQYEVFW